MRMLRNLCGVVAVVALVAPATRADEWNKLTILTFSGPVDVPGMTLPAGTYRFQLADPESGRRVVKVSNEDGSKAYGIFLSIPNQRATPANEPVVMFNETPAGMPPAVKMWFYPGETFGYEFVYPRSQAIQLARANHEAVLAMTDEAKAEGSDVDQLRAMSSARYSRVDENGQSVASSETQTAASTAMTTSDRAAAASPNTKVETTTATETNTAVGTTGTTPAAGTTAAAATSTGTTASTSQATPATTTANPSAVRGTTAAAGASAQTSTAPSTTASASQGETSRAVGTTGEERNRAATTSGAVGTTGQVDRSAASQPASQPERSDRNAARRNLPRTASSLPWLMVFSGLALAGALTVRVLRTRNV